MAFNIFFQFINFFTKKRIQQKNEYKIIIVHYIHG